MGLSDILKALETWDKWKRLLAMPDRLDELEKRLAAIEAARPAAPGGAPRCPACGVAMAFTAEQPGTGPFAVFGERVRQWRCDACGHETETRFTA